MSVSKFPRLACLSRVTSGSSLLWTPEKCFYSAKLVLKFPFIVPSLHTSNKKVYKTLYLSVSCFFLRSFHFANILAWTGDWWAWCLVCAVQNLFWRIQTSRLQGGGLRTPASPPPTDYTQWHLILTTGGNSQKMLKTWERIRILVLRPEKQNAARGWD